MSWVVGAPDSSANVFSHIILRGHRRFDFTVVSHSLAPELRPLVKWRRVRSPRKPFRLRWAVFFFTAIWPLRRTRADVVHSWSPAPVVPSRIEIASANMLQTGYHDAAGGRPPGAAPLRRRPARRFKLALERWSYGRRTSLVDVESDQARAMLERHVPGVAVIVTPRALDLERFRPDPEGRRQVRAELNAGSDDVVALFVGRDWDLKGLDLAVEGLALASRQGHPSLRLWVAGGSDRARLNETAARAGIGGRVDFLGTRSDIERLYQGADASCSPPCMSSSRVRRTRRRHRDLRSSPPPSARSPI